MKLPYVGTMAYLVAQRDAQNIVDIIRDLHSEFPISEFPARRPYDEDDSLGACLYWERDLMLNASIAVQFPTHDRLAVVKARNAGVDLVSYMRHHKMIRVREYLQLREWTCPGCGEEFTRTLTEASRNDPCAECLALSPQR